MSLSKAMILIGLLYFISMPSQAATLYERFGEQAGLTQVVDKFLINLAEDPRINHHFIETNIVRFRSKLIEFICREIDGPCEYTGDDMEITHRGLVIDDADFNAVVEALIEAMEAKQIPTGAQNVLLQRLARYYPVIRSN